MRKIVIIVTLLLFSTTIFYSIYQKETLLKNGKIVRLSLAPVDPRSLMQGDYMILNYSIADRIRVHIREEKNFLPKVVITLDKNQVANFQRVYKNEKLSADEMILNFQYRKNLRRVQISTNSYFFQEGERKRYEKARFGEFRVDKNGVALLTQLLDMELNRL